MRLTRQLNLFGATDGRKLNKTQKFIIELINKVELIAIALFTILWAYKWEILVASGLIYYFTK